MTYKEQLEKWVKGESVHNGTRPDGNCCPDFSCCQPRLLASEEERRLFHKAFMTQDTATMENMLMMFLGAAITQATDRPVYIAGDCQHSC